MNDLHPTEAGDPTLLQFDDNSLLPLLFGEHDQNLARIERQLGVSLVSRGNRLAITGPPEATHAAKLALDALYIRLQKNLPVGDAEVDAVVRLALSGPGAGRQDGRKKKKGAEAVHSRRP